MTSKPTEVNSLRIGGYILIDGVACRIVDMKHSKTGKHGHAKARIEAIGLIDGRRKELIKPSDAKVEVPIIEKKDAQIISMSLNKAQAMDLGTYETFEVEIPEELKDKIREGSQVLYWEILGIKVIKQVKS